ncbi:MAG: bifunctional phosphopantothenoylcysteine decarboxylase/phosphopantothenate--cysteine ligase CoaBC [Candidatus Aureabacteria bacterium]|nr:bifunctional phosphopantothenoylcysteine decarboxylase/phosphopantothenate--cysteine ligase CoaBC [Candidatus Auribacterota bacterium]
MRKDRPLVLLGIGGGVAAYKAVEVASTLVKEKVEVHVQMTEAALSFVTPLTFSAVTNHPVYSSMFPDRVLEKKEDIFPHLYPATQADVFAVMPATADLIAKFKAGLGLDLVTASTLALSSSCVRIFCPAMNVNMWNNPIVQANTKSLEKDGWIRIGPNNGLQACGAVGMGRMAEPDEIVGAILYQLKKRQSFSGKRILILSGPTREFLDPVRYIGNPSSGKMGKALALAALELGAQVDLLTGPVASSDLPSGSGLNIFHVTSAGQMLDKARKLFQHADGIFFTAAVSDYAPFEASPLKLPKKERLTLMLKKTPDIAACLCKEKQIRQVAFGFALETHENLDKAQKKLKEKKLDGIVLNDCDSFGSEEGRFQFLGKGSAQWENWGTITKKQCASQLMEKMNALFSSNRK